MMRLAVCAGLWLIGGSAWGQTTLTFRDGVSPDGGYAGTRDVWLRRDTYSNYLPDANWGTSRSAAIDAFPLFEELLLRWDLTLVPANTLVVSASMTFSFSGTGDLFPVRECLRPWVESEVTWLQFANGQSWQDGGATGPLDRSPVVLARLDGTASLVPLNDAGVAVVQQWVANPSTNHGFIIGELDPVLEGGVDLRTSETPTATQRPMLTLGLIDGGTLNFQEGVSPPAYAGTDDSDISFGPAPGLVNYNRYSLQLSGAPDIALVSFDLRAVPRGVRVVDAGFALYVRATAAQPVQVFEERAQWTELGASWATRDGVNAWAGDGGALNPQNLGPVPVAVFTTGAVGALEEYPLNAAGLAVVQDWVDGTQPNFGFLMTSQPANIAFERRESTVAARRPGFWVTFVDAGAPDAGPPDAGAPDAGSSSPLNLRVECGCSSSSGCLALGLLAGLWSRPRRGSARRPRRIGDW